MENRWSVRMAETVMKTSSPYKEQWCYENGLILKAIEAVWERTKDPRYFDYIKQSMDRFVDEEGAIRTYKREDYNIDQINQGKVLLSLYEITREEKYKKAAWSVREQLTHQPRTKEGEFWHKQIYPHQVWLDGLYMAAPFYARFGEMFEEPDCFSDVVRQVLLIEKHTRDPETGLLYHGWDESKGMKWADPVTGCSPNFWGRAMGWYAMAVVDVLDYLPQEHPGRKEILQVLASLTAALVKVQDPATGLWYQVLNRRCQEKNYLETSASSMFLYAIVKGVRKGYLSPDWITAAQKGYDGLIRNFVKTDAEGKVTLEGVCKVAGLGGNPYRDGSYAYYVSEPVVSDDYKGVGPFILASLEIEQKGF